MKVNLILLFNPNQHPNPTHAGHMSEPTYTELRETFENRRDLRVQCCDRYERYAMLMLMLVNFLVLLVYLILKFTIDTNTLHTIALCMMWSLFGLTVLLTIYAIGKCMLRRIWNKQCMVPFCCGCRWIERHQLLYEEA